MDWKKLSLASLLAALATFILGFIFWATPVSELAMNHVSAEQAKALAESLQTQVPSSGTYFIPDMSAGEQVFLKQHEQGPIATLHVRKEGAAAMDPMVFLRGFLHMFMVWLLVGFVLSKIEASANRYQILLLFAVSAAIWGPIGQPLWYFQPWAYWLMTAVYDVLAWAIGGAILLRFLRIR